MNDEGDDGKFRCVIDEPRCIYENDEILVEHSMMDFPDGTEKQ
ncbi:MAG: hypothetical protein Ct9H90mP24_4120 [Methanobacteriota archaeon]|nr:MAG: hypothetical protein Ct9H90mP24_4120 [Euryarchaeota archaeon]